MNGLLPKLWPFRPPTGVQAEVIIDERRRWAAYWLKAGRWCWKRGVYLACQVHDRTHVEEAQPAPVRYSRTTLQIAGMGAAYILVVALMERWADISAETLWTVALLPPWLVLVGYACAKVIR